MMEKLILSTETNRFAVFCDIDETALERKNNGALPATLQFFQKVHPFVSEWVWVSARTIGCTETTIAQLRKAGFWNARHQNVLLRSPLLADVPLFKDSMRRKWSARVQGTEGRAAIFVGNLWDDVMDKDTVRDVLSGKSVRLEKGRSFVISLIGSHKASVHVKLGTIQRKQTKKDRALVNKKQEK
jgi:hypothetical protein